MAAPVLVKTTGPHQQVWHDAHEGRIGGSRIANILGVGFQSPMRVYLDLLGEGEPVEENEAMYWGSTLEPIVAAEFERRNDLKTRRVNAILHHPKYDRLIASIDRAVVGKKGILEVKTTSTYAFDRWAKDGLPAHYEAQLRWYMMILGWSEGWVAALVGGQRYEQYHINRDKDIEDMMLERALDFLKLVDERTPPEIDHTEDCTKILGKLYPEGDEAVDHVFSIPVTRDINRLKEVAAERKLLEEEEAHIKNIIKAELGDAGFGYLPGAEAPAISWKSTVAERFDTKAFRRDHPELAAQYTKPSSYRTLRILKGE